VERHGGLERCRPEQVEICTDPLAESRLRSGTASPLLFLLYRIPLLGKLIKRLYFPPTTHDAMNLDHPGRGPLFPFVLAAAVKHSHWEFEQLVPAIAAAGGQEAVALFLTTKRPPGQPPHVLRSDSQDI
jgi:hypothetical protein